MASGALKDLSEKSCKPVEYDYSIPLSSLDFDSIAYKSHGVHGEKKSHGKTYAGATCLMSATNFDGLAATVCHNACVKGYADLSPKVSEKPEKSEKQRASAAWI